MTRLKNDPAQSETPFDHVAGTHGIYSNFIVCYLIVQKSFDELDLFCGIL